MSGDWRKWRIYLTHKFAWWYKHVRYSGITRKMKNFNWIHVVGWLVGCGEGRADAVRRRRQLNNLNVTSNVHTLWCDGRKASTHPHPSPEKPSKKATRFIDSNFSLSLIVEQSVWLGISPPYRDKLEGCDCSTKMILNWWKSFSRRVCGSEEGGEGINLPPTHRSFDVIIVLHSKIEIEFPSKWILSIAMKIWAI